MLVLFETAAGYALFKVLKEKKLQEVDDIWKEFETIEGAEKIVKLKAWSKFDNTTEALAATTALVESKLSKGLKKFLQKNVVGEELGVIDAKLGNVIKEKLGIPCVFNNQIVELTRCLRAQLQGLISALHGADLRPMSLGLSHSLSRYKLKFSPDKVDTMIVQAIGLLDDLDKELNTYAMRVREWYGWHFPEMTKIVQDNIKYARAVKFMGTRERAAGLDFSAILEEDVEAGLKDAAVISMGTEISQEDLENIVALCDQVIELSEYRAQLYEYLKSRMAAVAPNLTVLVGELVGARLISHAGSLVGLAKSPASTIQILGAEKALFRALKTKHETPKYGLIYHASLIGQAGPKNKGKISRVLAAKSALAVRVDALGESTDASVGIEGRAKIEARLRQLEGRALEGDAMEAPKGQTSKYDRNRQGENPAIATVPKAYNAAADVALPEPEKKKKKKAAEATEANGGAGPSEEPAKKKKKKAAAEEEAAPEPAADAGEKKKKRKAEAAEPEQPAATEKPKKKKAAAAAENGAAEAVTEAADGKKKKKKQK